MVSSHLEIHGTHMKPQEPICQRKWLLTSPLFTVLLEYEVGPRTDTMLKRADGSLHSEVNACYIYLPTTGLTVSAVTPLCLPLPPSTVPFPARFHHRSHNSSASSSGVPFVGQKFGLCSGASVFSLDSTFLYKWGMTSSCSSSCSSSRIQRRYRMPKLRAGGNAPQRTRGAHSCPSLPEALPKIFSRARWVGRHLGGAAPALEALSVH